MSCELVQYRPFYKRQRGRVAILTYNIFHFSASRSIFAFADFLAGLADMEKKSLYRTEELILFKFTVCRPSCAVRVISTVQKYPCYHHGKIKEISLEESVHRKTN